jgi:hypothetical protein
MHVADELPAVPLKLDQEGLEPVLEEVADPPMPQIELTSVPRPESCHQPRERHRTRAHDEMDVIGHQRPRKTGEPLLGDEPSQPIGEVLSVRIILKDDPALNCAQHDMVNSTRTIETSLSGHPRFPWDRTRGEKATLPK